MYLGIRRDPHKYSNYLCNSHFQEFDTQCRFRMLHLQTLGSLIFHLHTYYRHLPITLLRGASKFPKNVQFTSVIFVVSYILWGLIPYFEVSFQMEVGPLAAVSIRFGVSSVLLLIILVIHRALKKNFWSNVHGVRGFSVEKIVLKVLGREVTLPRIAAYSFLGMLFVVSLNFYFLMLNAFRSSLAIGVTLSLGLPPVLTGLFEVVFGKFSHRMTPKVWRLSIGVDVAIAGIGAALCRLDSLERASGSSVDWTGYVWIAGFVISWSAWMVIISREAKAFSNSYLGKDLIGLVWKNITIFASGSVLNLLILVLSFRSEGLDVLKYLGSILELPSGLTHLSPGAFYSINMMVLISTFLAYLFYFTAFSRSSDSDALSVLASVLQTVEPLCAVAITLLVWHQVPTNLALCGIGLVLFSMATILVVVWNLDRIKNKACRTETSELLGIALCG